MQPLASFHQVLQPSRKEHTPYVVLLLWISLLGLFTQSFTTAQFLEVRRRISSPGHETSPANNAAVLVREKTDS